MTQRGTFLKRALVWSLVVCLLAVAAVFYVQNMMQARQLEREILYRKARAQLAQEQHQQMLKYQKRLEQQRTRRQYNNGGVVGVQAD